MYRLVFGAWLQPLYVCRSFGNSVASPRPNFGPQAAADAAQCSLRLGSSASPHLPTQASTQYHHHHHYLPTTHPDHVLSSGIVIGFGRSLNVCRVRLVVRHQTASQQTPLCLCTATTGTHSTTHPAPLSLPRQDARTAYHPRGLPSLP